MSRPGLVKLTLELTTGEMIEYLTNDFDPAELAKDRIGCETSVLRDYGRPVLLPGLLETVALLHLGLVEQA